METIALIGTMFCGYVVTYMTAEALMTYFEYWEKRREVSRYASRDYCMCGDLMKGHCRDSAHTPVSEYDYHVSHVELVFK